MDLNDMNGLTPINGKSRKAYMGSYPDGACICEGEYDSDFSRGLLRNKLLATTWSRRLPDGNVMTAQEWLSGEILGPDGWKESKF